MKLLRMNGTVFGGRTALELVDQMRASSIFTARLSLDDYIEYVEYNALRYLGVFITIGGGDVTERARSLVEAMVATGLAESLPEKPRKGVE